MGGGPRPEIQTKLYYILPVSPTIDFLPLGGGHQAAQQAGLPDERVQDRRPTMTIQDHQPHPVLLPQQLIDGGLGGQATQLQLGSCDVRAAIKDDH